MHVEIEAKVRVGEHQPVRERLQVLGARFVSRVLECNQLLDRPDRQLRAAGCGLRLRTVKTLDGPVQPPTITFKGAKEPGLYKRRRELEVEVSDAQDMIQILAALDYHEVLIYEKLRESWQLGDCRVELDELPYLGRFVEVEGPGEEAIATVLSELDLAAAPLVPESYVALAAEWAEGLSQRTSPDRVESPSRPALRFPANGSIDSDHGGSA